MLPGDPTAPLPGPETRSREALPPSYRRIDLKQERALDLATALFWQRFKVRLKSSSVELKEQTDELQSLLSDLINELAKEFRELPVSLHIAFDSAWNPYRP